MATERLRIGMIGCGEIAVQTAKGIAGAEHAQHVMVMDASERVARDLGETYGVPATTDVEALLANPAVDAVYIAVPHSLHAPLTIRALNAGKHVLVEKPIATTLADAQAMLDAAREARRTLSVAFTAQVTASMQGLKRLLADGAIGKVTGTRIVYRSQKPDTYWHGGYSGRIQTDWRTAKATAGGGILIMNAVHDLNTNRFLTGLEVERVYAEYDTYTTPVEVEDFIAVTYRYRNGAIGTVEAGSAVSGGDPFKEASRIYGERGQVVLGRQPQVYVAEATAGLKAREWQPLPVAEGPSGDRVAIVEGFARAVLRGEAPPVTGADGKAILEIILAAYQSGQEHRAIELPLSAR